MKYLADIPLSPTEGFSGPGTGPLANPTDPATTLDKVISLTIGVITAIAFIWFTIQFFIGAISWITAGGDKGKLEGAQAKLKTSLVGLVVVISAIFAIQLIGTILGIEILEIPILITNLTQG